MNYAVIKNGKIINVITAKNDAAIKNLGAVPLPEGKWIGDMVNEQQYTAEDLFTALLGLEDNSSGGGVNHSKPLSRKV